MRLGALRRHWNRLGRRDPYWAVLTDPQKGGGGWDLEQFFRGGADEIAAVLQRADRLGLVISRRRALDFGCGVGRLTQAMAAQFERCDGVDISTSMLRVARRHNRRPERCAYHLNVAPDLALFADATFSFVYSALVLQHMEPRYSQGYIRELLRVLAPDGLLVFQLPSHRAAQEPSATASRTPIRGRLPATACKAHLVVEQASLSLRAGEEVPLTVTVQNCSSHLWPALPAALGHNSINLANHWLAEDGELLQRDDARCPLPHDLAPGSRSTLMLGVTAPPFDGTYWLELDLVQENVGWFAERGSAALRIPCHITGGRPTPPRPAPPVVVAPEPEPFRRRHPRAFRALKGSGLRDVYWKWRHAWDWIKGRRDRVVWWLQDYVLEPVIPRLANRVVAPVVNWWKGRPFAPRMEMYCVSRSEVLALLAGSNGRLVDVEEELMPGGFQSCRYWVRKTDVQRS